MEEVEEDWKKDRNEGGVNGELPPLYGMKKTLNLSPKRKIITLKLPKVEISQRDTQRDSFPKSFKSQKADGIRYLSMSVECSDMRYSEIAQRTPIKSTVNSFLINLEDSKKLKYKRMKLNSLQLRLKEKMKIQKSLKMSKKNLNEEILVKGENKSVKVQVAVRPVHESGLYNLGWKFRESVENKYGKGFDEIDINRKGWIVLDDFINMIIFMGLNENNEKEESYLKVKKKASEIFSVFFSISLKNKILKNDFFAVCSICEFFNPEVDLNDFLKFKELDEIKKRIGEAKKVFEFYSKDGNVDSREFRGILAYVHVDDIFLVTSLLFAENVGFGRFLCFLPIFLWVHQELTNKIEAGK